MKITYLFATAIFCMIAFTACKKEDSGLPYGKMQVTFSNEASGQPIVLGPLNYTNASGNQYSVDLLKYYVTNFTLVKADGTERNFKNYQLVDADNPASLSFTLDSVANAEYTTLKFYLGVDSSRNHTGVQDGALDPVNGMIWIWNTGYIFFKHEGNFKTDTGTTKALVFHYGADFALVPVSIPLSKMKVAGDTKKVTVAFDLNKAYAAPNPINFNYDNNRMSTSRDDVFWLSAMSGNFSGAFSLKQVQ